MSNAAHNRPPKPADVPAGIPAEMQAIADTLNAWTACFRMLKPGAVSFRVDLVDVVREGQREVGVQLWTMLPTGPVVVTIPPDLADELAAKLVDKAREARSGIASVPAGLHTANGRGRHD